MRMPRAVTLAFGLLAGSISAGFAQEAPDTTREVSVLRRAEASRWHVRALLLDGDTVEGRVREVEGYRARIGSRLVAPEQIARLERRLADQTDTKRGALIGGVAGALFGALVLVPFCAGGFEGDCGEGPALVLASTTLGATLGATAGGVVSIGETVWEPVWSR